MPTGTHSQMAAVLQRNLYINLLSGSIYVHMSNASVFTVMDGDWQQPQARVAKQVTSVSYLSVSLRVTCY